MSMHEPTIAHDPSAGHYAGGQPNHRVPGYGMAIASVIIGRRRPCPHRCDPGHRRPAGHRGRHYLCLLAASRALGLAGNVNSPPAPATDERRGIPGGDHLSVLPSAAVRLSVGSLIVGIVGLVLAPSLSVLFLGGPIGLILGPTAMALGCRARRRAGDGPAHDNGYALIGTILGAITLVLAVCACLFMLWFWVGITSAGGEFD